jgi:hypothetical protein
MRVIPEDTPVRVLETARRDDPSDPHTPCIRVQVAYERAKQKAMTAYYYGAHPSLFTYSPSPSGRGRGEGQAKLGKALVALRLPYAHLQTAVGKGLDHGACRHLRS